jgi:hypothetical protein
MPLKRNNVLTFLSGQMMSSHMKCFMESQAICMCFFKFGVILCFHKFEIMLENNLYNAAYDWLGVGKGLPWTHAPYMASRPLFCS